MVGASARYSNLHIPVETSTAPYRRGSGTPPVGNNKKLQLVGFGILHAESLHGDFAHDLGLHGLVVEAHAGVVFPDYQERISSTEDGPVYVGALLLDIKGYTFFTPIMVSKGNDTLMTGHIGYHNVPDELLAMCKKEWTEMGMLKLGYQYLITWYGIQIALLHPTVKDVFQNPMSEAIYTPAGKKGKHRRFVRYIRRHVINADDIHQATCCSSREFERHTLVWYVIGHWRHYADGKRVFIQPYWKGALRQLKMSLDGRDRSIVL